MFSLYGFFFVMACGAVVLACFVMVAMILFNDLANWQVWGMAVLFGAFVYKEAQL